MVEDEAKVLVELSPSKKGKEILDLPKIPEKPKISLHPLMGSSNPRTMRVKGKVAGLWVVILIDSSSTHNFVDPTIAKRSKFLVCMKENVKVRVANGDQLLSEGKGQGVKVNIQGVIFSIDLFVLDLAGCDVVLGIQRLQTLGNIA